jgi:hypothetical protein
VTHRPTAIALLLLLPLWVAAGADTTALVRLSDLSALSVVAGLSLGAAETTIALKSSEAIRLEDLFLHHPMLWIGTIERGPLIRLIDSPTGPWTKAPPASLVRPREGSVYQDRVSNHGVCVSPIPGRFALIALREPGVSITGIHLAGPKAQGHYWETLSTLTLIDSEKEYDDWAFERPPALSSLFAHTLARVSLTGERGSLHLGGIVSASRFGAPGLSAASSGEVSKGTWTLSADVTGITSRYREIDGTTETDPLRVSWLAVWDPAGGVEMSLGHTLRIERLPVMHIPFRRTDESLNLKVICERLLFDVCGIATYRLQGDRVGILKHSFDAEIGMGRAGDVVSLDLDGRVSFAEPDQAAFGLSVPWSADLGRLRASGTMTALYKDELTVAVTLDLSMQLDSRSRLFIQLRTRQALPLSSVQEKWEGHDLHQNVEINLGWSAGEDPSG